MPRAPKNTRAPIELFAKLEHWDDATRVYDFERLARLVHARIAGAQVDAATTDWSAEVWGGGADASFELEGSFDRDTIVDAAPRGALDVSFDERERIESRRAMPLTALEVVERYMATDGRGAFTIATRSLEWDDPTSFDRAAAFEELGLRASHSYVVAGTFVDPYTGYDMVLVSDPWGDREPQPVPYYMISELFGAGAHARPQ